MSLVAAAQRFLEAQEQAAKALLALTGYLNSPEANALREANDKAEQELSNLRYEVREYVR